MLTTQMTDDTQTRVQGAQMPGLPAPSTFNPTMRPKRRPADATTPGMPAMPAPTPALTPAAPTVGMTPTAPSTMPAAGATPAAAALPAPPKPLTNPGGTVPTTPIDPANDLRSSAILPTSTPQIDQARTGLINTTGAVTGYDRNADVAGLRDSLASYFGPTDVTAGAGVSTAPSGRLSKYNTMLDESAGKLAGVDRVAMAKDLLAQFDDQQLPEHELALRKLTDQYVAKGGGKSGMVRTAYGNEDIARQRDRDAMKKSLISAALEGSIQDRFNTTSALSGLQSGTAAQDAATRGEQRTDRGYATDVATGNVDRRLSARAAAQAGASSGADANRAAKTGAVGVSQNLFDTLNTEGLAQRAETRGERGYQNDLESQSYGRGMTELQMEQQQKQQETARQLALLAAGEGGNPTNALTSLANGAGGLDPALIAQLAKTLGQKSVGGGGGVTGGTIPGTNLPLPAGITLPDYGGLA